MTTTPHPDFIDGRLTAIGRELDLLVSDRGRHLSRRMILELAYRRGWQDGRDAVIKEDNEATRLLIERKDRCD